MTTKYGMMKAITGAVSKATSDYNATVKFIETMKKKEEKDKVEANYKKAQTKYANSQAESVLFKTEEAKKKADELESAWKNIERGKEIATKTSQLEGQFNIAPIGVATPENSGKISPIGVSTPENRGQIAPIGVAPNLGEDIQNIGQGDGTKIGDGFQPGTPEFLQNLSKPEFRKYYKDPTAYMEKLKKTARGDAGEKRARRDQEMQEEDRDIKIAKAETDRQKKLIEGDEKELKLAVDDVMEYVFKYDDETGQQPSLKKIMGHPLLGQPAIDKFGITFNKTGELGGEEMTAETLPTKYTMKAFIKTQLETIKLLQGSSQEELQRFQSLPPEKQKQVLDNLKKAKK